MRSASAGDGRLRVLSRALQEVHRELVDLSRASYESRYGPVQGNGDLFRLLLHDEAFAWLRSLSDLIVELGELSVQVAVSEEAFADVRARVEAFMSASDPDGFGSRYVPLLVSEPRVAMSHFTLRTALDDLSERYGYLT
jgi:hypothetical protein